MEIMGIEICEKFKNIFFSVLILWNQNKANLYLPFFTSTMSMISSLTKKVLEES